MDGFLRPNSYKHTIRTDVGDRKIAIQGVCGWAHSSLPAPLPPFTLTHTILLSLPSFLSSILPSSSMGSDIMQMSLPPRLVVYTLQSSPINSILYSALRGQRWLSTTPSTNKITQNLQTDIYKSLHTGRKVDGQTQRRI